MAERLYRTQILLEPEQHRFLARIAEREDRSLSEVVREIIRAYLNEQQEKDQAQKELEALQRLREIREESLQRYGVFTGDMLQQIREERDQEIQRTWKGEE
jgi:predicted DNA-binding protein